MKELSIKIQDVTKSYGKLKAVRNLSFEVQKGQCFGLLGPNGAGKTTMIKILHGKTRRDHPQPGQVNVFGYDPEHNELEIKYLSGIVPQENNLDQELSVRQNLLIYARFYGLSKGTVQPQIKNLLNFMELSDKKDSKIKELSGGMKRRLIIARALINSPKLLILDEPTTGLDPQVRNLIWDRLRGLKRKGVTIVLTTHYMEEAFQLCDNLIIMHNGGKILEGRPTVLVKENMEPFVLEIFNTEKLDEIKSDREVRLERTDSKGFMYSDNLRALETVAAGMHAGDFYLRQSNLEDLFLKTTGRQLNE
jgi:lipooligosaccharide transport system ATP-binding protein